MARDFTEKFWQQPASENSLIDLGNRFFQDMANELAKSTLANYPYHLKYFVRWCYSHNFYYLNDLNDQVILDYKLSLIQDKNSLVITYNTYNRRLTTTRNFIKWLVEKNLLENNPLKKISIKKTFWEQQTDNENCFLDLGRKFFKWMQANEFAPRTISDYKDHLRYFIEWSHQREIYQADQVNRTAIERYQSYVYRRVNSKNQQPLSTSARKRILSSLSQFFIWLTQQNHILYNPADQIQLPKIPHRLPRNILTAKEIREILSQPDTTQAIGIRDRAILETLYATGVRRQELVNLAISDVFLDQGTLLIRQGKTCKDRYVPLTFPAIDWLEKYMQQARPELETDPKEKTLFLNFKGNPIHHDSMGKIVLRYIRAAGIEKNGSCHLFRHSIATILLENGVDLRYVQQFLGHSHLEATQIYTKVSIGKLKEVHKKTHPAKLKHTKTSQVLKELEDK